MESVKAERSGHVFDREDEERATERMEKQRDKDREGRVTPRGAERE